MMTMDDAREWLSTKPITRYLIRHDEDGLHMVLEAGDYTAQELEVLAVVMRELEGEG